jgi:hypothetical protein
MRVAIIISGNVSKAPYISYYSSFFKNEEIEFDVISWNRLGVDDESSLSLNVQDGEAPGFINRFLNYLKYRRHIINILQNNGYDKIVIFTIAIAIMMYPYLKRKYPKKFLFDIRDHSLMVRLAWCFFIRIIDNSFATIVSSYGYSLWLPKSRKYIISHNFPFELSKGRIKFLVEKPIVTRKSIIIFVTAIGSLRDFDANKLLMKAFKERKDFCLKFIGSGPACSDLKSFVVKEGISNVYFHGTYVKAEEVGLLAGTTIINNFTNYDLNSRTLTSNRFYLSVVLAIPMIVRQGTYQAKLCKKYNLGCVINPKLAIPEQLVEYINSFDNKIYNSGRLSFLKLVMRDTELLNKMLKKFVGKDGDGSV